MPQRLFQIRTFAKSGWSASAFSDIYWQATELYFVYTTLKEPNKAFVAHRLQHPQAMVSTTQKKRVHISDQINQRIN